MTHTEALAKATKLLRLATSSNPHEAALAAARAQEVMARFKITNLMIGEENAASPTPTQPIQNFADNPLASGSKLSTWKNRLALIVAKVNQCKVYLNGKCLILVGKQDDAEIVRYLYAWLVRECDRLLASSYRGQGGNWAASFRLGMLEVLETRLEEQRKAMHSAMQDEQAENPLGLVRLSRALVSLKQQEADLEEWLRANLNLSKGKARKTSYNDEAREAGQAAGRNARLQPVRGELSY